MICVSFGALRAEETLEERHDALLALAEEDFEEFSYGLEYAIDYEIFPEEWILEAEIVEAMVGSYTDRLLSLAGRIEEAAKEGSQFRVGYGRRFISLQQLSGFASCLRSAVALRDNDTEGFERYLLRAFRDAPYWVKAFGMADHLIEIRESEAKEAQMANVRVPMNKPVVSVDGESRTLRQWMGNNKALLIDFWASWCGPCMQLMPELKEKSDKLSAQGIFVAGLNTDSGDQLELARKVRTQRGMESVPWLLDPNGSYFSEILNVDSIPRMVLLTADGEVLYNGHPSDPKLHQALAKVGASL